MTSTDQPFFPDTATEVTWELGFGREGSSVYYFFRGMPVFTHGVNDIDSFRMITAKFCVNGRAEEVDIACAFGVSQDSVRQAVEIYRAKGSAGFYPQRPAQTQSRVSQGSSKRKGKADKTR